MIRNKILKNKKTKRYTGNALTNAFLPVAASLGITFGAVSIVIATRSTGASSEISKSHEIVIPTPTEKGYKLTVTDTEGKEITQAKKDEIVVFTATEEQQSNGVSKKPLGVVINEKAMYKFDPITLSTEVKISFIEKMEVSMIFPEPTSEYVATFHLNNGTEETSEQVIQPGECVVKPTDPVWKNHQFEGWYTGPGEYDPSFDFDTPIEGNVDIYAHWSDSPEIQYWDLNITQPESSIGWTISCDAPIEQEIYKVKKGDNVKFTISASTTTKVPSSLVLDYNGASSSICYPVHKVSDTEYTVDAIITTAADLTAHVEFNSAVTYTVTFDSDGGSGVETQKIEGGTKASEPNDPSKTGYTFNYWYKDNKEQPFDFNSIIDSNTTLHAKWTINKYNVKFLNDNGSLYHEGLYDFNSIPTCADPTESKLPEVGKTKKFVGWSPAVQPVIHIEPETSIEYTAVFSSTTNQYRATFNTNGGSSVSSQVKNYGSTLDQVENPTRTGYDFVNWTTSTGHVWDFATDTLTQDETLTANWTIHKYKITFKNYDGSVLLADKLTDYNAMPEYVGDTPTKPSHEGQIYKFSGWSPALVPATKDTTYTALYSETTGLNTVTFHTNCEAYVDQQFIAYNNKIVQPADPSRTGYTFAGWYKDKDCTSGQEWTFATDVVKGDQDLYAKWIAGSSTVQFVNTNGTVLQTSSVTVGDVPSYTGDLPTRPDSEWDYQFSGWSPAIVPVTDSGQTITYTAQYNQIAKKKYSVSFDTQGGGFIESQSVEFNSYATEPPVPPSKTGYDFAGWYTAPTGGAKFNFAQTTITSPKTLYAQWTQLKYTITFMNYNKSAILKTLDNQTYGTILEDPGLKPTKPSTAQYTYVFAGWQKDGSTNVGLLPVTESCTYVPYFEEVAQKYAVQFETNGGSTIATQIYAYNTKITVNNPTKSGKTFDGWYTNASLSTKWDMSAGVTKNMILYAKWK